MSELTDYPLIEALLRRRSRRFAPGMTLDGGPLTYESEEPPARLTVDLRDLIWDALYAPLAGAVVGAANSLNRLQFLTVRQFLSLVFGALVLLLLVLAIWQ